MAIFITGDDPIPHRNQSCFEQLTFFCQFCFQPFAFSNIDADPGKVVFPIEGHHHSIGAD
jgi:mannitol/fructose-specific phosphotransferase system IIA component (Ntr-type)